MKSFFELPEYQIFHVLRGGESEPCGPYSPNELVYLLNGNELSRGDLVSYPGISGWRKITDVFEFHDRVANFESEGHDQRVLDLVFAELTRIAGEGESFYDVVIQEKGVFGRSRTEVAALSDRGIWIGTVNKRTGRYRGSRLETDEIRQVSARYPNRWDRGVLHIDLACGGLLQVKRIPRRQLRRFAAIWRQLSAERWQKQWRRPLPVPVLLSGT